MNTIAFIGNLRPQEIILIALVILVLFGAKRLPEFARSFGKSIREFKKATKEIEQDIRAAVDEEPKSTAKKVDSETTRKSNPEPEGEVSETPEKSETKA